jgi:hypothetical protein
MMNDFAERMREEESRSCEVKDGFTLHAAAAQPFNCRGGLTALPAERWIQRNQAGPAFRTCASPPALQNLGVADDARDGKKEIENVVEQGAFGGKRKGRSSIANMAILNTENYG